MSTISNRFMVTAIEDGTTLHGTLIATKSLAQSYNNGSCTPDWSVAANQPIIYISLYDGSTQVAPDSNFTWSWNGTALVFNAQNKTADGRFEKTTYNVGTQQVPLNVPALKIIGNLASSENLNVDVISFSGSKTISTSPITFSASTEVRITEWVSGGYLGVLYFPENPVIDNDNDSVMIYAMLYNESGTVSVYNVEWYVNEVQITTTTPNGSSIGTFGNIKYLDLKGGDVVDYATVKCVFYIGGSVVWTEYIGVDDVTDPEFLYIQQSTGDGNAASLRSGDSVTFRTWVNTMDDASIDSSSEWETFKVLLLDSTGEPITGSLATYGITAPIDQDNYRDITVYVSDASQKYGQITIPYAMVEAFGKNVTGMVLALTASESSNE